MKQKRESGSREVGLKIGCLCGEYFLKLRHLHYGYWTEGLNVDISNLGRAQEEYVKFLLSHIPQGVKTILDVGCGAGQLAQTLLSAGYAVDCVSPSAFLTEQTLKSVGDKSEIFECKYEELETQKRYDLILFVESFQYIDLPTALANTARFLNAGGHMLVCDIFKQSGQEKSRQSGGHDLDKLFKLVETSAFTLVEDIDITEQTAPNIDLLNDALEKVGKPVVESIADFLAERYPTVFKLLSWKYQDELDKISKKYSGGSRTGEQFRQFKSYRLLLYRKDRA
jgi:2-polyprenyl-3-methyl-5-hydroxy-6-metoxy-1,4-benzoquinol methylase